MLPTDKTPMTSRTAAVALAALSLAIVPSAAHAQDEAPSPGAEVTVVDEVGEGVDEGAGVAEADEDPCGALEEEEAAAACEAEAEAGDAEAAAAPASTVLTVKKSLKAGWVDGGTVKLTRAGKVTQQLRYRGKVVGTASKTLKKAGRVRMRIKLTRAGRKALAAASGPATLGLKTTRTLRNGKAATSSRKVILA